MKTKNVVAVFVLFLLLVVDGTATAAETLTLRQTIQRVIDTYPTLEIGKLQTDKAAQEITRAQSQLGWQLNAQAGASHDLGLTNAPADTGTAGIGVQRQLQSGGTLGVQGGVQYTNNSVPFPGFPNPLTTTKADIQYRKPLGQGAGNPLYQQSAVASEAGLVIARANHRSMLNQVVQQTINLYYGLATTQASLQNASRGVQNAEHLLKFVQSNERLGLAEKKDLLQAQAQLRGQKALYDSIKTAWEQQRTSLNRLMGRPWNEEFQLTSVQNGGPVAETPDKYVKEAEATSPEINSLKEQLKIAEAQLKVSKDKYKSKLDLVLSAGARNGSGPGFEQSDYAASAMIEYQRPLSRQGLEAEVYQAQISQDIARRQIKKAKDDLRYQVEGLVSEMGTDQTALSTSKARYEVEKLKVEETRERYRTGRADTTQLLLFENELHQAEYSVDQLTLELARKQQTLKLLRGVLWDEMQLEHTGLEAYKK
ncbi:MAG: TolC family protein [Acidiferrobacterales bacterium]